MLPRHVRPPIGNNVEKHSKIDLVLLFLAVTAVATARYW
jgi:hypothetical protein